MGESINQVIELINIGIAVLALFVGIWVVLMLVTIAVRAVVRQLGLAQAEDTEPIALASLRSRANQREGALREAVVRPEGVVSEARP